MMNGDYKGVIGGYYNGKTVLFYVFHTAFIVLVN